MSRRSHRKSRNGCFDCKRRHIKCDENTPECVNCVTAGKSCSFKHSASSRPTTVIRPAESSNAPTPTPAPTPLSSHNSSQVHTPVSSGFDSPLSLEQLEMFHHFCNFTVQTLSPEPEMQEVWRRVVPRYGLRFPFLMCELLALGASHLGYLNPSQRETYHHRATDMQNHAMTGFHAIEMKVDESNCAAVLLFSSLLALQVLADPSLTKGVTATGYIDHFCQCLNLMHGTRILVVENWWPSVQKHEDLSLLWKRVPLAREEEICPAELRELSKLAWSSSLSDTASKAYDEAIADLRWQFSMCPFQEQHATVRWALAWPIALKKEYLNLLGERRPEALIVLAYFGAFLHSYRHSWIMGDNGARLVNSVNEHVGSRWADWMKWPLQVIS